MRTLRGPDGPPLPVDEQLRGRGKPKTLLVVSVLHALGVGVRVGARALPFHRVRGGP